MAEARSDRISPNIFSVTAATKRERGVYERKRV
jgi:hypothetical protein